MRYLIRSKLFVPGSRPELFAKAMNSAADAVSFDLEDAVAAERKDEARNTVATFLRNLGAASRPATIVRVNHCASALFEADLRAVIGHGLDIVNLPMVESAHDITATISIIEKLELEKGTQIPVGILANIETPKGFRLAAEIAAAHPRVIGLQIGYADLFEPTGIDRSDPSALAHIRLSIRLAAAEAGIAVYDGAYAKISDPDGFRAECQAARKHGFAGKSCIHPSQIAIANACFSPSAAETAQARRILSAAAEASANGIGAFTLDGAMIDAPFLERARAIVAAADSLKAEQE